MAVIFRLESNRFFFFFFSSKNNIVALLQSFEKTGGILFKYRGQIPVLIFILAVPVLIYTNSDLYLQLFVGQRQVLRIVLTILAFLLSLSGLVLRAYTVSTTPKGTSGRNRDKQVAKHLNTVGIYSVVRHPLYLANYLVWAGILVFTMNVWAFIIVSLVYWLYYERIMFAEEAYLRSQFNDEFEAWAERVPAFIPKWSLFQKGDVPFSVKTFIRREYATIYSTVFSYTLVDYLLFVLIYVRFHGYSVSPSSWLRPSLYILAACTIVLIAIHTIKHHTHLLDSDATRD